MKKRELKKGEWFVASENGINKFKHSLKTFFIFVFLPVLSLQLVSAYFFLPLYYVEEFAIIKNAMAVCFSNFPSSFFRNFLIFSVATVEILKLYLIFLIVTSPLFLLFGYLFFNKAKERSEKLLEEKFIEGSRFLNLLEVLRIYCKKKNISFSRTDKEEKLKEKLNNEYNFELAGVPLLKTSECAHVLIPGSSRKGKSQMMRNVIFKAKEMSKNKKARGIITDEKGEWLSKTFDANAGDLIFNPSDERTLKWNIFNDIENIIDIENYTTWLIPTNEKDPFWTTSAQQILKSILIYLFINNKKTNKDLRDFLDLGSEKLYELISTSLGTDAAIMLSKEDSYRTFRTYMKFIDFAEDGDFSIKKWVNESEKGFIYLTINEYTKELLKPILTLFVNVLGRNILRLDDNYNPEKRIYFFLEEFTSLSKLTTIISLLKLSGSKGCSIWLIFQDFSQIEKIYSKVDQLSIINNCSSIVSLGINEQTQAEYLSKLFGEIKIGKTSLNHSIGLAVNRDGVSIQEKEETKPLVTWTALKNLEPLNCYVKLDQQEGGVVVSKIEFKLDEPINKAFILNPYISNFLNKVAENSINKKIDNLKMEKDFENLELIEEDKKNILKNEEEFKDESELIAEETNKSSINIADLTKGL